MVRQVLRVVVVAAGAVAGGVAINQVLNGGEWNWWALGAAIVLAVGAEAINQWFAHRDSSITAPSLPQIPAALSGIPRRSDVFAGRDVELNELQDLLVQGERCRPVLVAGMPGVGKTELVLQAADHIRQKGRFPGGVLFKDMRGYEAGREVAPDQALGELLQALSLPGDDIPDGLEARARRYRSVLASYADQGRPILVVIDNASSPGQVQPLLPSDEDSGALITSRHTLDVHSGRLDLDILGTADSVQLLDQALRNLRGPADTRVTDAPEDAAKIAALCSGLPLALDIAAFLLADAPNRKLEFLRQALEDEHSRLDRLSREERAVRAVFDLSYQRLTPDQARLFRLLPLDPGPDLSTRAAAHLAGADEASTEELLLELARAHLVRYGRVWGRWQLHDLIRLYADELGRDHAVYDDASGAQERLLKDYYVDVTHAAATYVSAVADGPPDARFADRASALEWLDSEYRNIVAAALESPVESWVAVSIFTDLDLFLQLRSRKADRLRLAERVVEAMRHAGDHYRVAIVLGNVADALSSLGRHEEAVNTHRLALDMVRAHGDKDDEAMVLHELGDALAAAGGHDEALTTLWQAVALKRKLGNRQEEAASLHAIADILLRTGNRNESDRVYQDALDIFWEVFPRGAVLTMWSRGLILQDLGRRGRREALNVLRIAQNAAHENGFADLEADILMAIGVLQRVRRKRRAAIDAEWQAVTLHRSGGDKRATAQALCSLAENLFGAASFENAGRASQEAAILFREVGDESGEIRALKTLGMALSTKGKHEESLTVFRAALAICRRHSDEAGNQEFLEAAIDAVPRRRLRRHRAG